MKKRFISALLSAAMLVSVIPTTAFAQTVEEPVVVSEESEETDSGLSLNKTVKLEENGTYTITLEAYAKGETQTVYTPMDILFVVDQSGSMLQVDDASKNVYVDYDGDGTISAEIDHIEPNSYIDNLVDLNGDGQLTREDEKIKVTGLTASENGKIQYYSRDKEGNYLPLDDADFKENAKISGYYINATSYMISTWNTFYPAVLKKTEDVSSVDQWENVVIEKKDNNKYYSIKNSNGDIKYNDINGDFVLAKTRYGVVTDVTTSFINQVHDLAAEKHTDHRMGLVGFAGDSYNGYDGTALYVTSADDTGKGTWTEYKYNNGEIKDQYKNTFRSVQNDNAFLDTMRDYKAFSQQTRQDIGLTMANSVFENIDYTSGANKDRKKIVIFITDGAPSPGEIEDSTLEKFSNYESLTNFSEGSAYVANESIAQANKLKKSGVEIYSIGLLRENAANNETMKYMLERVSSNYSYSENLGKKNAFGYMLDKGGTGYTASKASKTGYCHIVTADDSLEDELQQIFDGITKDVTTSTVALRSEAVLKDIIASEFTLPNEKVENVQVETCDYLGNGQWAEKSVFENAGVTVKNDTVSVTGFDYAGNCVSEAAGSTAAGGKKLIVTIKNVLARGIAATGEPIYTNGSASGIYPSAESTSPAALFKNPTVTIPKKAYVLDFAKPVEVKAADWNMGKVIDLDDAALDDLMSTGTSKIRGTVFQKYGTTERIEPMQEDDGTSTGFTGLRYTPQTTKWDGYDRSYVFGNPLGKNGAVDESEYMWSRIDFIPATNVYYEDSFVTSSSEGIEGITYSEGWSLAEYVQDADEEGVYKDLQSDENIVYGSDALYAENLGYSDGNAHVATSGATAKFTFTGTGVDIYTRTDNQSGQVLVQAVGRNNGKIYTALVDNKFESVVGGLYQIPTVAFANIERDTYDVTITVIKAKDKDAKGTYYLDAIRVYNPVDENADLNVKEAYTEAKEDNAVTATVREYMLNASNWTTDENGNKVLPGAVYVDKYQDSTYQIGDYEDYGPKNEVYLKRANAIAFEIETPYKGKALIGLKAVSGEKATVEINGKDIEITSSTDLYYEIEPTDGKGVIIKNKGEGLISVTKLRLTEVEDPQEKISLGCTTSFNEYIKQVFDIKENSTVENPFTDVKEGSYYYDAVIWAVKNNITSGCSKDEFGTGKPCTRGEAITFIWRLFNCPEPKVCTSAPFEDISENGYYYKAVLWATEARITFGVSATEFAPEETITKGEFLTFLYRARHQPECTMENPFKDVSKNKFYYNAVLWAVENGITTGISEDTFGPERGCTREQIVTLLWRDRG